MHFHLRCLILVAGVAIDAYASGSSPERDTWTILSPKARDMSAMGANWTPSAQQVVAARDAAKATVALAAKTVPPVGSDEWRLRDARDITHHWKSYRLQAWGYTKHQKKLIRLNFFSIDALRDTNWRQELVVVSDGGSAFWQADYDPATGKILWWQANGVA